MQTAIDVIHERIDDIKHEMHRLSEEINIKRDTITALSVQLEELTSAVRSLANAKG